MYKLYIEHAPRCGVFPAVDDLWTYVDTAGGYRLVDIWNFIKSEKRYSNAKFIIEHNNRIIWEG